MGENHIWIPLLMPHNIFLVPSKSAGVSLEGKTALPHRGFSSIAHISGVNNSFCLFNSAPKGLFELVQASSFFNRI